jgi:RNA polymerase sigma-70 factor, ECF subfamily
MKLKTESELTSLARSDRLAFAELYERYVDKVYTYVYYRTGNRALTEDIVSDTFLKALDRINDFVPQGGGFGAWLYRMARNQMVDYRRREGRLLPIHESMPDRSDSPEQQAIRQETGNDLRQLVAELPEEQKEAVILKYSLGLKNREIAGVMDKSETAVSSLLHRALENLREEVRV